MTGPAMALRRALDLCSAEHADDWIRLPGERPATAMLSGLFDSGARTATTTILAPDKIAVYEPDPRLSLVWPVRDDDMRAERDRPQPEWLDADGHNWRSAREGWAVVLLGGAPIWQDLMWYLDWGSGVGGYVADFQAMYSHGVGEDTTIVGWETTTWAVGLASLLNSFSSHQEFHKFDPTFRVVSAPSALHPIDAERHAY